MLSAVSTNPPKQIHLARHTAPVFQLHLLSPASFLPLPLSLICTSSLHSHLPFLPHAQPALCNNEVSICLQSCILKSQVGFSPTSPNWNSCNKKHQQMAGVGVQIKAEPPQGFMGISTLICIEMPIKVCLSH